MLIAGLIWNAVADMGSASRQPNVPAARGPRKPRRVMVRVALATAMTVVGLNIWTGAPLLALWVGAQVQRQQSGLTRGTVGVVIAVMAMTIFVLYRAL